MHRAAAAAGRLPIGRTADGTTRLGDAGAHVKALASRFPTDRLGLDRLPTDRLGPVSRLDGRVLAVLGVLIAVSFYGLIFANPAARHTEQVAAAELAAKPVAKPDPAPAADAAPVNPLDQGAINDSLRALRKAVGVGDQPRSLLFLADGTMGTTIVHEGIAENVMVRGKDLAVEPLASEPEQGATLDLEKVHGTAITRVLDRAATVYRLPAKQLASLRLIEHPSKPGTFIWSGVWTDADRTELYANREGTTLAPSLPR